MIDRRVIFGYGEAEQCEIRAQEVYRITVSNQVFVDIPGFIGYCYMEARGLKKISQTGSFSLRP